MHTIFNSITTRYITVVIFALISSCTKNTNELQDQKLPPTNSEQETRPNIMLIIADDMGLDATPRYQIGGIKPQMPNLENMMDNGIRFTNLWSYATCSPTRASILTGKYGFRTNVIGAGDHLATTEISLQNYIDQNTANAYNHAVIGKWHLSNNANHPNSMGIDYFSGFLQGAVPSFWNWNHVENGIVSKNSSYTTTFFADSAIEWIGTRGDNPWFLWLAFNAPHTPFHLPDPALHHQGNLPEDSSSIENNPIPYYHAMLEAMDTEMGRILNSMTPEMLEKTVFIFLGDNGSPNKVAQGFDSRRVKGSIYQGGINVPMVISGHGVKRSNAVENALINTTDLFATIAEISGVKNSNIHDSKSIKALFENPNINIRDYTFAENRTQSGGIEYAVRNSSHKYIRFSDKSEALYDIGNGYIERPDLLSANQLPLSTANATIKNELSATLNAILSSK